MSQEEVVELDVAGFGPEDVPRRPHGAALVIRGWDDGLVGQRVGSRLLLSIPSELGYGDRGVPQAGIRGGDTLVFVTEILGVM